MVVARSVFFLKAIVERFEAAPALYVADGDAPKTRTSARVISDCMELSATAMACAIERAPLRDPEGALRRLPLLH